MALLLSLGVGQLSAQATTFTFRNRTEKILQVTVIYTNGESSRDRELHPNEEFTPETRGRTPGAVRARFPANETGNDIERETFSEFNVDVFAPRTAYSFNITEQNINGFNILAITARR